jgi:hypothetical protein
MYQEYNFSCCPSSSMIFEIWRAARLLGIALFSNITNPTVYSSTGVGRHDELETIENERTCTTSDHIT